MAKCDEGYRCDVCGRDVESILESDLYLRYVLGEVPLEQLHRCRERHISCNPALAQYIVDEMYPPIVCEGPFAKAQMDADFVRTEENRVTAGWRRLREVITLGISIVDYPLTASGESP